MENTKTDFKYWQDKIEDIAKSIPEDEICPRCQVNIVLNRKLN